MFPRMFKELCKRQTHKKISLVVLSIHKTYGLYIKCWRNVKLEGRGGLWPSVSHDRLPSVCSIARQWQSVDFLSKTHYPHYLVLVVSRNGIESDSTFYKSSCTIKLKYIC